MNKRIDQLEVTVATALNVNLNLTEKVSKDLTENYGIIGGKLQHILDETVNHNDNMARFRSDLNQFRDQELHRKTHEILMKLGNVDELERKIDYLLSATITMGEILLKMTEREARREEKKRLRAVAEEESDNLNENDNIAPIYPKQENKNEEIEDMSGMDLGNLAERMIMFEKNIRRSTQEIRIENRPVTPVESKNTQAATPQIVQNTASEPDLCQSKEMPESIYRCSICESVLPREPLREDGVSVTCVQPECGRLSIVGKLKEGNRWIITTCRTDALGCSVPPQLHCQQVSIEMQGKENDFECQICGTGGQDMRDAKDWIASTESH